MLFANRLGLRSSNPSGSRLSINNCYASSEIQKGKRTRRTSSSKRGKPKQKKTQDLKEQMDNAILTEELRWKDSTTPEKPVPVLARMIVAITSRLFEVNRMANGIMHIIFEEQFPDSRSTVDYFEFRLLESDDFPISRIVDFFLEFGYVLENEFVLRDKEKPVYCKVLQPPRNQQLPKIVFTSLKIDEDLSQEVKEIIKKKLESWKPLSVKYTTTALGCCSTPWELPDKAEMDHIFKESQFAAWCMIHGFTPSCIAISVNEMQSSKNQDGTIPTKVALDSIFETLEKEFPINPAFHEPIWTHADKSITVVDTVAEVCPVSLTDDKIFKIPGSHIAFIERSKASNETSNNYTIDLDLISYMYGSIDASLSVDKHFREIHEAVLAKAKQNGRVLTLDGSNEDDEALYDQYLKELIESNTGES